MVGVGAAMSDDLTIDPKNFATIRTTSIVQRQQKEHLHVSFRNIFELFLLNKSML